MDKVHPYEKFRELVKPVLQSKLDEFRLMDYQEVSEEDLWNFLITKRWRMPKEDVRLYEIVNQIMNVKPGDFLAYTQVEQLRGPDWFSDGIDPDEWKELLK